MSQLLNRVQMSVSGTPGTGTITLGAAVSGYQSFANAGVIDQGSYSYLIVDGANWEFGEGTYSVSGTTLARTLIFASSNGGAAISASSAAIVSCVELAGDLVASPVRQTVQSGPASSGAPSFLPSTSASLSITTQNISNTSPLILTAAAGFNSRGPFDRVLCLTANQTFSSLTASATNFLFINASTGVTGSTILQPIYQFGGTISVTSGQFTFDYQAMIGYLGNGSAAVATPLVCVGFAVTSASAVTSTGASPYNGYYESVPLTTMPAAATFTSYNSNMLAPADAIVELTFRAAINGYSVGDKLIALSSFDGSYMHTLKATSGILTVGFTTSTSYPFYYQHKTTGAEVYSATSDSTNYSLKVIQRRVF